MATLDLVRYSDIAWNGGSSTWRGFVAENDSTNYYWGVGAFSTSWGDGTNSLRTRFKVTIPAETVMTGSTKLVFKFKPDANLNPQYARAFLTTADWTPNTSNWNASDVLSVSALWADENKTTRQTANVTNPTSSYYFVFNYTGFTAGTTYYIYIASYGTDYGETTNSIGSNTSSGVFIRSQNTDAYMSITLHYSASTYTISYNANGGSGAPANQTKTYGVALTLSSTKPSKSASSSSSNFTITGNANGGVANKTATATKTVTTSYTFSHWNTAANGSGTSYNAGASFTVNANTTLYAIYTSSTSTGYSNNTLAALGTPTKNSTTATGYTVTFDANGGTCSTTSLTSTLTTSYAFKGWGSTSSATTALANSTAYTSAATVYAIWTPSTANGSVTLPTPTKEGYVFAGWATSASASNGVYGAYTPTSATTLYAIWVTADPVTKVRVSDTWQIATVYVYQDGWKPAIVKLL